MSGKIFGILSVWNISLALQHTDMEISTKAFVKTNSSFTNEMLMSLFRCCNPRLHKTRIFQHSKTCKSKFLVLFLLPWAQQFDLMYLGNRLVTLKEVLNNLGLHPIQTRYVNWPLLTCKKFSRHTQRWRSASPQF